MDSASVTFDKLWAHSPADDRKNNPLAVAQGVDMHWAACWIVPNLDMPGAVRTAFPFTVEQVVDRLNELLESLCATYRFVPDPLVSSSTYAWMEMRDHAQAWAVAALGRIAVKTLMDEHKETP